MLLFQVLFSVGTWLAASVAPHWHENAPFYVLFFDCNIRTSSGRHRGNKLQLGHRAAILPESGGGGVLRAATFNAWAMVSRVLARNCSVKCTLTRRRDQHKKCIHTEYVG